jgi:hypothetical protein
MKSGFLEPADSPTACGSFMVIFIILVHEMIKVQFQNDIASVINCFQNVTTYKIPKYNKSVDYYMCPDNILAHCSKLLLYILHGET